jgi:excisionase family DNA binding protein
MDEGALLSLEEAAERSGYRKRELRALVREGRLPAVRSGKRWQVAPVDLAALPTRNGAAPEPLPTGPAAAEPETLPTIEVPTEKAADPLMALIELLRERDQKLGELLEERSQLTGQVGFLLGQLSEREERIHQLERAALTAPAGPSVSVLPIAAPVALIDQWTTPASGDPALSRADAAVDSRRDLESTPNKLGEAIYSEIESAGVRPGALPEPVAPPMPHSSEMAVIPPPMPAQPRRGLFGLFRRRVPG